MANGNGRHLCPGSHFTDGELKLREYSSLFCSACMGRGAVELPEEDEIPFPGGDGAVRDKRRFTKYLRTKIQKTKNK